MKGNFHARFWIGGEESDLLADHTEYNAKRLALYSGPFVLKGPCWLSGDAMRVTVVPLALVQVQLVAFRQVDGEHPR